MFLVVGLGNPGREYEGHRHNIGFRVVDAIREEEGWPDYKAKFAGVWTRGSLGGEAVALLKPQGYMNFSGESVQPAAAFLKVGMDHVIVVHDELDLVWKDIRVKVGGGHAGHNGVRSIIERLGGAGIRSCSRRNRVAGRNGRDAADWVLSNFDPVERAELPEVVLAAAVAVRGIIKDGVAKAMNRVNGPALATPESASATLPFAAWSALCYQSAPRSWAIASHGPASSSEDEPRRIHGRYDTRGPGTPGA